jgi:aminoglycoside phosphotransferase (APT) family kinase protein
MSLEAVWVLPPSVLADVADIVGGEITILDRLAGGINAGAMRVQLHGSANAVLKVEPWTHANQFNEILRAQRIVQHMRGCGYPTPAWLGVGITATHVWHLTDFVDAAPVSELTPSIVEQLIEVIELQAGQASGLNNHWSYAWRVVTHQEPVVDRLSGYSSVVSALVERVGLICANVSPASAASDMVHADFNPSNILVHNGAVVAIVDIGNAGSGTRATDLVTLLWHTFREALDSVRARLWDKILAVAGWDAAAVLAATQILLQLEWPIRLGRHDVVAGVVERGHRCLDELIALR